MNDKQIVEIGFWKNLFETLGKEKFLELRKDDFSWKTKYAELSGKTLDVGCGLVSILEFSDIEDIYAIDPLMSAFDTIYHYDGKVKYFCEDGENIPFDDGSFDSVLCVNVLDHTPNPQKMIDEIYRVLKVDGVFNFSINFDDNLSPAHYGLWNEEMVDKYLSRFTKTFRTIERNEKDNQSIYYGKFKKN